MMNRLQCLLEKVIETRVLAIFCAQLITLLRRTFGFFANTEVYVSIFVLAMCLLVSYTLDVLFDLLDNYQVFLSRIARLIIIFFQFQFQDRSVY